MKKLLIHNNNTSFNSIKIFPISEQFVFDIDVDKDVDTYIDEILNDEGDLSIKLYDRDAVFIKVALSENYLEYLGLRLAYHIRFSKSKKFKNRLPIIFIGEESFQFLGKTCPEPTLLFTSGIYLIKENMSDFEKVIRWFTTGTLRPSENISLVAESVSIKPPANYESHHSIANEWALARYFSMFERNPFDKLYNSLAEKVSALSYTKTLHFKSADAKSGRERFSKKKQFYTPIIHNISGLTIGLIEDEYRKGWLEFYTYWFTIHGAKITAFEDFSLEYTKEKLVNRIIDWLTELLNTDSPIDLFIIDLRLHPDDFETDNFEDLSGIQIINRIKSINPGIQIVVSTASNKVWTFQKCIEYKVNHFAIKESPETFNTREETKSNLNHLSSQISDASSKVFLAKLYRDIQQVKRNNVFISDMGNTDFRQLVFSENGLLDQIFNLLALDVDSPAILNQCLLICFQILENYCDLSSIGDFGDGKDRQEKVSSGYIYARSDGTRQRLFVTKGDNILTRFELQYGTHFIQVPLDQLTPISFTAFEEERLVSPHRGGVDATSLVKVICVLFYRDHVTKATIDEVIKLRYYRSNVAAHLTGKVKPHTTITFKEIDFFIQLITKIFSRS